VWGDFLEGGLHRYPIGGWLSPPNFHLSRHGMGCALPAPFTNCRPHPNFSAPPRQNVTSRLCVRSGGASGKIARPGSCGSTFRGLWGQEPVGETAVFRSTTPNAVCVFGTGDDPAYNPHSAGIGGGAPARASGC